MVKEPTKPPEGAAKPQPPPNVPSKQGVPLAPVPEYRRRSNWPTLPMTPDPLVVTAKAACDEHLDCTKVTTEMVPLAEVPLGFERGRTSDPGYVPGTLTDGSSPDRVPVTPTVSPEFLPPGERPGEAGGPFWDVPPADLPPDFEGTIHEPYAIIKDMRALYTDFVDDVMDATRKLRSAALRWLCRAIALTLGSVVLSLLAIGAVGVVGAVMLFKALDAAEYRYWAGTAGDLDTLDDFAPRERPWK